MTALNPRFKKIYSKLSFTWSREKFKSFETSFVPVVLFCDLDYSSGKQMNQGEP
jgi:hypothetical protein